MEIFTQVCPRSPSAARAQRQESASEPMAIDYSRRSEMASVATGGVVSEGADILGLAEDDDIGEKYLSVKKASSEQRSGAAEKQAAECETNTPVDGAIRSGYADRSAGDR